MRVANFTKLIGCSTVAIFSYWELHARLSKFQDFWHIFLEKAELVCLTQASNNCPQITGLNASQAAKYCSQYNYVTLSLWKGDLTKCPQNLQIETHFKLNSKLFNWSIKKVLKLCMTWILILFLHEMFQTIACLTNC